MKTSEQLDKIAPALVRAQQDVTGAKIDAVNPFLKNKYATLSSVREAILPALDENGLAVIQLPTTTATGEMGLTTRIMHESGQWLEDTVTMALGSEKGKSSAQVAGSIISYFRRYALAAAFNIVTDEDTDGNGPGGKKKVTQPRTNGNGRKPVSKPASQGNQGPDPSNYVDSKSAPFKEFMVLGRERYGDEWDDKRAELCQHVTKGRTRKSTELYGAEFTTLLQGLRDKRKQAEAA